MKCGFRVAQSYLSCIVFCRSLNYLFILFLLTIVVSVHRSTASDYTFGISKLSLNCIRKAFKTLQNILVVVKAKMLPCNKTLFRIIRGVMLISPSFTRMVQTG